MLSSLGQEMRALREEDGNVRNNSFKLNPAFGSEDVSVQILVDSYGKVRQIVYIRVNV